jgi:hypothetical protein
MNIPSTNSTQNSALISTRRLTQCGNTNPTDTANHLNPQITEAGKTLVTELPDGVDRVSLQALQASVCQDNGPTCATASAEYDALTGCTQSDVGKLTHIIDAVHTAGVSTIWGVPETSILLDPVMTDCH